MGIFYKQTKDWLYGYLPAESVPGGTPSVPIEPNRSYVSLRLKCARIVNSRVGFKTYLSSVHCHSSLMALGGKNPFAEFHYVSPPTKISEVDPTHADKIVVRNKLILGPIAYRGGKLAVDAGLFAIVSENLAEKYLSFLDKLSQAAGVSYIKMAEPFVAPIQQGIDLFFGTSNPQQLETGFSEDFGSDDGSLKTGYLVVGRVETSVVKLGDLVLDPKSFNLKLKKTGAEIRDWPYMVFQILASPTREDALNIPEIKDAHEKFTSTLGSIDSSGKDISDAFGGFKRVVLTSNDLLKEHARQIVKAAEEDWREIDKVHLQATGRKRPTVKSLNKLKIKFQLL